MAMKKSLAKLRSRSASILLILLTIMVVSSPQLMAIENATTYNNDIGSRLSTRCPLVRDYLSERVRINDLANRQNKVRGWEYILRRMESLKRNYINFDVKIADLDSSIRSLRQQLEQFKVDFEAYDREFQRLLNIDCARNPQAFWNQLNTLRSFRSGVALASENYKASLSNSLIKEGLKW